MKNVTPFIASLLVYVGLPASFVATALHEPAARTLENASPLLQSHFGLIAPLLFVSSVMSVATILVHHLREEQRLQTFAERHLRFSAPATAAPVALPAKARLAKVAAI